MALFSTGPDFLTGILGAQNSDGVLNKFKKDNADYKGLDYYENRYGQQIGDDGYLKSGPVTTVFYDTDGDGIDDRFQSGPGEPRAGSNPNASPIFGGGNPPPGGGGGGDSPFSPQNRTVTDLAGREVSANQVAYENIKNQDEYDAVFGGLDSYDPSNYDPDKSLYATYTPRNLGDINTQFGMSTGYPANDLMQGLYNSPLSLFSNAARFGNYLERKFMPETLTKFAGTQIDKLVPESVKTTYSDFMSSLKAKEDEEEKLGLSFNDEAFASFLDRYQNTPSYSDIGLDFADDIREAKTNIYSNLTDVDPTLANQLDPTLSLADYTNNAMSLTNEYNTAIQQQAQEKQAEQDRINQAVASGYLGYGYDAETGNYGGLVTGGPKGGYIKTGYNPNVQNENYHKQFSQAEKDAANTLGGMKQSYGKIAAGLKEQAEKNKNKNKNKNNNSGGAGGTGGSGATGGGSSSSGGGYGGYGCFIKGTMVEMADGTEKEITSINVGEETKGGTVQAKMEYMPHNIYDYKGVKVSGSHWVMEDGQFTEVENSKHGVLTDMIEPVYNFMTSKHRIFIKGVEFGGFYSQDPDYYEPYFKQEKDKINKELNEKRR